MAKRNRVGLADDPSVVEQWRERVARWRASGLKAAAFATNEGVKPRQLSWWAAEMGRRERGVARTRKRSRVRSRAPSPSPAPPTFVALRPRPAAPGTTVEVLLPSGLVLRVPADFDEAAVRRLVATLGAA